MEAIRSLVLTKISITTKQGFDGKDNNYDIYSLKKEKEKWLRVQKKWRFRGNKIKKEWQVDEALKFLQSAEIYDVSHTFSLNYDLKSFRKKASVVRNAIWTPLRTMCEERA